MRTITELYTLKGCVYVRFCSDAAYEHFKKLAKEEGFTIPAGDDDILALDPGFKFCHPGWAGHMFFYHGDKKPIRIDYFKWIIGADDYIYHGDGK